MEHFRVNIASIANDHVVTHLSLIFIVDFVYLLSHSLSLQSFFISPLVGQAANSVCGGGIFG